MANALIITESAAEAFHTHQILTELFSEVKACNRLAVAKELFVLFKPDLVVVSDLPSDGADAASVMHQVSGAGAGVLLCAGLGAVIGPDPIRSVRIVPPLTVSGVFAALEKLDLARIVNQTFLPLSARSPAND